MSVDLMVKSKTRREQKAVIESKPEVSLLDLAEEQKIRMPFGCRSGSCGACLVDVREGANLLEPVGPVEEDTLKRCKCEGHARLACRASLRANASGVLVVATE